MPRKAKHLYARIATFENLWEAYLQARKGKRYRADVAAFIFEEQERLSSLHKALCHKSYQPKGYQKIFIKEPKRRLIAKAPFEDRVVHHAIHRVLAPVLLKSHLPNSYACLKGRGSHRAILSFQQGLRRYPFFVRLDVARYFLEIRWDILRGVVARKVKDDALMHLLDLVLQSGQGLYEDPQTLQLLGLSDKYKPELGKGLPIGNLTSQLFANVYLDEVDHFIKRQLEVPHYIRYMDDLVLFGDKKAQLQSLAGAVVERLASTRKLEVRFKGGPPKSSRTRFTFLGYTVDRERIVLCRAAHRRLKARLCALGQDHPLSHNDELEAKLAGALGGLLF